MLANGILPNRFLSSLKDNGIKFFTGVPDSLLKEFNATLLESLLPHEHIIAANEGAAIGMAMGHYFASGSPALVYMQNSGLGNSVNPLTSLADPLVMGCPMLLLIGWRGEVVLDGSQLKDEPQHKQQGRITLSQLDTLEIPYQIIDKNSKFDVCISSAITNASSRKGPVALVVRKDSFAPYLAKVQVSCSDGLMSREQAIRAVLDILPNSIPVISTTGMPSRELYELREHDGGEHKRDLLCVGGMGHAVSIATGIALALPEKQVVCLDGDGAMLMQLGAITNSSDCANLIHIVLNNGAHDSVGGQPTRAADLNLSEIATACGYSKSVRVKTGDEIRQHLHSLLSTPKSSFLEILCKRGNRSDLGRPKQTPAQNCESFMHFLEEKND